jgi:ubiquitin-conjugating enzyme E2 D/E
MIQAIPDAYPETLHTGQVSSAETVTFVAAEDGSSGSSRHQQEAAQSLNPQEPIAGSGGIEASYAEDNLFTTAEDKDSEISKRATALSRQWMLSDDPVAAEASATSLGRFRKELRDSHEWGIEGTDIISVKDRVNDILGWFDGPPGTPYAGGVFYVRFYIPGRYPHKPPVCRFLTQIYHPNIDSRGRICMDTIEHMWSPALTMRTILLSIQSLLSEPSAGDPLVPEIAETFIRDKAKYEENARLYTEKFALRKIPDLSDTKQDGTSWYHDLQVEPSAEVASRIYADQKRDREAAESRKREMESFYK